jgi:hypothetical protein
MTSSLMRGRVCRLQLLLLLASVYSRPYFTLSDSRLPFLSPLATRSATVEVFDPASTQESVLLSSQSKSQSYITTDGQSASLSWNIAPIWG